MREGGDFPTLWVRIPPRAKPRGRRAGRHRAARPPSRRNVPRSGPRRDPRMAGATWHALCSKHGLRSLDPRTGAGLTSQSGGGAMNPRNYVDLKESSRNLQPTYYFMINCLLYSRMETGLVSNQDFYDEDVNVYLAHLLHSFINPDYVEQSKKYLSKYDADVFKRLSNSTDARLKYSIYKTNADFLLVSIGIFDNPLAPTATPLRQQAAP